MLSTAVGARIAHAELKKESKVYENYSVYGAKKVRWQLNREGIAVGRCRTERLMRSCGLVSAVAVVGKTVRTTAADRTISRRDLVQRQFTASAPPRLWWPMSPYEEARVSLPTS